MKFDPEKITYFARTDARGKDVPFGIKAKDRQRHVYVIGKTGMGKSTLLENMAAQDIMNGEGMAFIDPHGSAAETLLSYIPEHRKDDVVYFAPADTDFPVSFNIMEDVGPDKRHLVVSGLMSVFKKIWVDAWSARMEYILQNTILALLEYPDSTLMGVNRMLSDKAYREKVVANVKDPGVRAFWVDEFAKYNERYMQEAGDAIKNKIGQFTANPVIRNIIGQPKSSFDIRKIMDEQKIIIMNLSKGLIGETNANLLGSMLTTRIYLAAMSRADLPPEKMRAMPNFYFYVDEFQSFANATFANILSEARKYHLNLTIAHQYIEQMEEDVRNAVFGNVGTIISFRVGPFDAEVLETIFSPQFLATDIVNLSFAQIYLTLMIDGIGSQPFSARTLPSIRPPSVSCKDMVIAASRQQFARPRAQVEEDIRKFHEPIVVPKPAPRKLEEGMHTTRAAEPATRRTTETRPHSPRSNQAPKPRQNGETTNAPQESSREVVREPERRQAIDAASGVREDRKPSINPESSAPRELPQTHVRESLSAAESGSAYRQSNDRVERPREERVAPKIESSTNNHGGFKKDDTTSRANAQPKNVTGNPNERLNDLRSVLRDIVAREGVETTPASEVKPKNVAAPDLKQTLAAVLQPRVPPAVKEESTVSQVSNLPESTKPVAIPHANEQPVRPASPSNSSGITPEELERMMRVNPSDRPPL